MRRSALALAFAASLLGGCYSVYQTPVGSTTAQLTLPNEGSQPFSLHIHGNADECTDRQFVGSVDPGQQKQVSIAAGRHAALTFGIDAPGAKEAFGLATGSPVHGKLVIEFCHVTIDFMPEPGRSYVLRTRGDGRSCSLRMESVSPGQTTPVAVALSTRKWTRALTEAGPFCEKRSP
jgi:hypothetical protein